MGWRRHQPMGRASRRIRAPSRRQSTPHSRTDSASGGCSRWRVPACSVGGRRPLRSPEQRTPALVSAPLVPGCSPLSGSRSCQCLRPWSSPRWPHPTAVTTYRCTRGFSWIEIDSGSGSQSHSRFMPQRVKSSSSRTLARNRSSSSAVGARVSVNVSRAASAARAPASAGVARRLRGRGRPRGRRHARRAERATACAMSRSRPPRVSAWRGDAPSSATRARRPARARASALAAVATS